MARLGLPRTDRQPRASARRLCLERLDARCMLAAAAVLATPSTAGGFGDEPFSYVDVNNDGFYEPQMGDVKLGTEVADGKFDTRVAEGNYKKVVPGAGLVLGGQPGATISASSINFVADGEVRVRINLTAKSNDVVLKSRTSSVVMFEGNDDFGPAEPMVTVTSTKGNVKITAAEDFTTWGDMFHAAEDFDVTAGGTIFFDNSVVTAGGSVELKAGTRGVVFVADAALIGPVTAVTAHDVTMTTPGEVYFSDNDSGTGPRLLVKNNLSMTAGTDVVLAGTSATWATSTEIQVGGNLKIKAGGDVTLTGFDDGGTNPPVDITTGGEFKAQADGQVVIANFPSADVGTPVAIHAGSDIVLEAPQGVTAFFSAEADQVTIKSTSGTVDVTDAVLRAYDKIDIEADLLAVLTQAQLGILNGSRSGLIEVSAQTIDLAGAELVAPKAFELHGTRVGTPAVFNQHGTVPP